MGGLFKGSSNKTSSNSSPWGPQQPYIKEGFDQAGNALQGALETSLYSGPHTASMSGDQRAILDLIQNSALGDQTGGLLSGYGARGIMGGAQSLTALENAGALSAQALGQTSAYDGAVDNAAGVFDLASRQAGGIDAVKRAFGDTYDASAGALRSAHAAQGHQDGINEAARNVANVAGRDMTRQTIKNAGRYADNPHLQGQIDATLRDVQRGLGQDLNSINSAAVGTGNMNSTRAGVVEGMARRDAMDRAADISSQMRGAAYDRGLGLAAAQGSEKFQQRLAAQDALGSAQQSELASNQGVLRAIGAMGVGAGGLAAANDQYGRAAASLNDANSGFLSALGQRLSGTGSAAGINAQYGSMANSLGAQGQAALLAGRGQLNEMQDRAYGAAQREQLQRQAEIDGRLSQSEYLRTAPLDLIGQYMGVIGGNYGGITTSRTPGASPLQQIGGTAATFAGIYGGMQ